MRSESIDQSTRFRQAVQSILTPLIFLISDIDIYRPAKFPIREYGEDAPIHVAKRADEMPEQGDGDGLAVRKRIP